MSDVPLIESLLQTVMELLSRSRAESNCAKDQHNVHVCKLLMFCSLACTESFVSSAKAQEEEEKRATRERERESKYKNQVDNARGEQEEEEAESKQAFQ